MQTILVIDDDENVRETIGVLLEQEGFKAVLVGDGRSGFETALKLKPALVLVDLRLPGMNGTEVCKQLRAAGVKTPMIVLSAIGDEVDKVLLLELGADDYITKPFGTRELLARVRAVLRRTGPEAHRIISFADTQVDLERRVGGLPCSAPAPTATAPAAPCTSRRPTPATSSGTPTAASR